MTERDYMRYADVELERIPFARDRLTELANDLRAKGHVEEAFEIDCIVGNLMYRKYSKPVVARPRQAVITGKLVEKVLAHIQLFPRMSNRRRGRAFNIDGGRVSEIQRGLRTPEDPTMSRLK